MRPSMLSAICSITLALLFTLGCDASSTDVVFANDFDGQLAGDTTPTSPMDALLVVDAEPAD